MADGVGYKVASKADLEKIPIQSPDSMRDDATYTVSSDPEELEVEPPRKRLRRLRNKLIVDKTTTLNKSYMRERVADTRVELRCQTVLDDAINIRPRVHGDMLLSRPVSKFGNALGAMVARRLARDLGRTPVADSHVEEILSRRPVHQQPEEIMQAEPSVADKTVQEITASVMQDISNVGRSARNVQEVPDISDLPTQKLTTVSQQERASQTGESQRKTRSQRISSIHISAAGADKENIPAAANIQEPITDIPTITLPTDEAGQQANVEYLTSMLHDAGLAEQQQRPPSIEPTPTQRQSRRIRHSEGSETPLGSLDRTKVSLGDTQKTTDSKRFLDDHWGVQGTMLKIFHCVASGITPVTVEELVRIGPVMESRQRITAARCFSSILKLTTHGFIKVTKNKETNAIKNIELGPRITKNR
ncbi:uncharacterized protein [Maniola hyperantus]|uniref:uncharacterized protein n=1 Tax=Aphantopus hyperantus TaxID=2795564 RepID=UPI003749EF41